MEPHSREGDNPKDVRPVIALGDNTTELIYSSFRSCDNQSVLQDGKYLAIMSRLEVP